MKSFIYALIHENFSWPSVMPLDFMLGRRLDLFFFFR